MTVLAQAIAMCNLPNLIAAHYPDAMRRPAWLNANAGSIFAAWRNEKSPSVSLAHKPDGWVFCDHGNGDTGGNAFHFLVQIVGVSPRDAAKNLIARAGLSNVPSPKKCLPPSKQIALPDLPEDVVAHFRLRKFFRPGKFTLDDNPIALKKLGEWLGECAALQLRDAP